MLLSAVSVLVVAQSSSEIPEGLMNNPVLEQYMFPRIETFEQEVVSRVIFMQDGAPPHFSCFVTDVLNERSLMPGLEGVDQYPGHLEAQISLHLMFSCGGTLRTLCMLRR